MKLLALLIKRCCKSSNTNCNTYIKLTAATTAPCWCCQKINLLTKKWTKSALNEKVCFLLFPTSITFLLLTVTYQPYLIFWALLYQNYHTAKAHSIPKHIFKIWKLNRKLVSYYGKVKETNFTSVKKAKILSFLGTKRCQTEKLRLKPLIFFRDSESCMS